MGNVYRVGTVMPAGCAAQTVIIKTILTIRRVVSERLTRDYMEVVLLYKTELQLSKKDPKNHSGMYLEYVITVVQTWHSSYIYNGSGIQIPQLLIRLIHG